MDIRKLAEMMSATLSEDKNQRESAEEHLKKVKQILRNTACAHRMKKCEKKLYSSDIWVRPNPGI